MNEEQELLDALNAQMPRAQIRCKLVSGMWIIEVVDANRLPNDKQQVADIVNQEIANQGQNPLWKMFLYADENERFIEDGTLHTVPQSFGVDGTPTTTLAAEDCYLDLGAFDTEALQLGLEPGLLVLGRESKNEQGQPILPYQPNADYLWLEAVGGNFGIGQNGVRQLANGNIEVTLDQR